MLFFFSQLFYIELTLSRKIFELWLIIDVFLWLRIVKNGTKKADIAAGWFQALCNSVPNLCNMKRIWFKRCSLGLEMP